MEQWDVHLTIGDKISGKLLLVLLDQIYETGSINKAVEAAGISYRNGLNILNKAENSLGIKITERQSGGPNGGGSTLTADGFQLMGQLKSLQREVKGQFNSLIGEKQVSGNKLMLASTTEPIGTGLLDALEQAFSDETGISVYHISAGSGQAMEMAKAGRVDAVLTHAPEMEKDFVQQGWGVKRTPFMKSHFVLVGPKSDPAGVLGAQSVLEALDKIVGSGSSFISRADQSGTHMKETSLWNKLGIDPENESWYIKAGPLAGNRGVLSLAEEQKAYAIVDLASYAVVYKGDILSVLLENEDELENIFSIIPVSRTRSPVNQADGELFAEWLGSAKTAKIIAEYRGEKWEKPLFVPITNPE